MTSTFQKIEPVSKKERVISSLKGAILSGALKAGEAIVEGKVAQQFGVGQGLIREALIDLEHQGFVQRTPFSGTQVVKLSADDAQQIFDIRIALEPLAVSLAGGTLTAGAFDELERLAATARRAGKSEDLDTFFESHLAWRRRIWELSANKYLRQTLEWSVVPLYALYFIRRSNKREGILNTVTDCIQHQDKIMKAYKDRDFTEAQEVARDFLVRMKDYLGSRLQSSTSD